MQESLVNTNKMQVVTDKIGYGKRLLKAREAAGLSQQEVADSLHLEKAIVDAIEQEDYSRLPAAAFARGYIRSYSLLVNCDANELVGQYNQSVQDEDLLPSVSTVKSEKRSNDPLFIGISIIVFGGLLGLLFVWGYDFIAEFSTENLTDNATHQYEQNVSSIDLPDEQNGFGFNADQVAADDVEPFNEEVTEQTLNADAIEQVPLADVDSTNSIVEVASPDTEPAESLEAESLDELAEADAVSVTRKLTPVAPSGTDRMRLSFNGQSWVEVIDANGAQLVFGLYDQNVPPVSLQGQAPFQLILGNAKSVDVSINESLFDIQPYIRSNNTARFLVESPAATTNN